MKKELNRREFLKQSFLGAGMAVFVLSPLKSLAKSFQSPPDAITPTIDVASQKELYLKAKEFFYKKEYVNSENMFLKLIESNSANIVYYDGYAKVLGAQQKSIEIAELYRIGLNKNNQSPYFLHRLSISLRKLCTGNSKAEKAFSEKYGIENVLNYSAELLLEAISIKSTKGFLLDLKDYTLITQESSDKKNYERLDSNKLSKSIENEIVAKSATLEERWNATRRKGRKANIPDNDLHVQKVNSKNRRQLHFAKDIENRERNLTKERKDRWIIALNKSIAENKPAKADNYGFKILAENKQDSDTIGKLRSYYKKNKYYERLITLNRYVYIQNSNYLNALVLASTLISHSKDTNSNTESKQLLKSVTPYVNTLPPTLIGCYYITQAQLLIKESKRAEARKTLLEGLKCFDGRGGVSYTLLEKYASSYTGKNLTEGISILKAICGKVYKQSNNEIWPYVESYLTVTKEQAVHKWEQIKQLYALSKLQKKNNDSEYTTTLNEIAQLKTQIGKPI